MGEALAFIHQFVTWLASFFPRPGICATTHGGVKFKRGKKVVPITPGIYWWIPAWTEIKLICVVEKPTDVPSQSVTSLDMKSIAVSITLTTRINDVVAACTKCEDIDNMVMNVAALAATPIIYKRTFEETMAQYDTVVKEILEVARRLLNRYGTKVPTLGITDITETKVHRHIGDPQYTGGEEEEE